MKTIKMLTGVTLALAAQASIPVDVAADVLCRAKKGGVFARATCKKKETPLDLTQFGAVGATGSAGAAGAPGAPGAPGSAGAPGTAGADGQLRIYGDGSAGARTVAADENWADPAVAPANPQFTDFTVAAGVTLIVPSGTVIRCTGTFTNQGTIVVEAGVQGGDRDNTDANTIEASVRGAHPGHGRGPAGDGELGPNTISLTGGEGANAFQVSTQRQLLSPGAVGGGAGGGGLAGTGGSGGGSLTVLAATAVVNQSAITADADLSASGAGGGGGGIVILASRGSVTNSVAGGISARGSDGGASSTVDGAGGGGGGGIVHLLAPQVTNAGTVDVAGGSGGTVGAAGSVTVSPRSAGGGGAASGGDGGTGGGVTTANTPTAAGAGAAGNVFESPLDPTALF